MPEASAAPSAVDGTALVLGGSSGLGRAIAEALSERGTEVVLTSRDAARAALVAAEIGGRTHGLALDLARPAEIAERLVDLGDVRYVVLAAIERDDNSVRAYDLSAALRLVTLKLVGYTEAVHALLPVLREDAAILLFGGLAKVRPYPGSTTITTVNGGITALVRTLAVELAPIRVNALHPGIVGDSPTWSKRPAELETVRARTPTGRLVSMGDIADAALFLLGNPSVNGVNLVVDGGTLLT